MTFLVCYRTNEMPQKKERKIRHAKRLSFKNGFTSMKILQCSKKSLILNNFCFEVIFSSFEKVQFENQMIFLNNVELVRKSSFSPYVHSAGPREIFLSWKCLFPDYLTCIMMMQRHLGQFSDVGTRQQESAFFLFAYLFENVSSFN